MEAIKIFPANLSAAPLPGTQWLVVSLVSVSSCPLEAERLGAEYPGTVSVEQVLPSNQHRNSDTDTAFPTEQRRENYFSTASDQPSEDTNFKVIIFKNLEFSFLEQFCIETSFPRLLVK